MKGSEGKGMCRGGGGQGLRGYVSSGADAGWAATLVASQPPSLLCRQSLPKPSEADTTLATPGCLARCRLEALGFERNACIEVRPASCRCVVPLGRCLR